MSEITVSEQHRQAIELHQKIIVSANLAQQNIWDMCNGLKTRLSGDLSPQSPSHSIMPLLKRL